jgi:acetoin utilization protein AcuB
MLMPSVKRFMTREPYSIASTDTLLRAKSLMNAHAIRHLPVVDGDRLVGIVCDRDVAIIDAMPGIALEHVEVGRVMDAPVSVWIDDAIDVVSTLMAQRKCDCVVVRGKQGVVGIFTATDALEALSEVVRRATA